MYRSCLEEKPVEMAFFTLAVTCSLSEDTIMIRLTRLTFSWLDDR